MEKIEPNILKQARVITRSLWAFPHRCILLKFYQANNQIFMKPAGLKLFVLALFLAVTEVSEAQLINGNFATGDLTGWTTFVDEPGGDVNGPSVVYAGGGINSYAMQIEVGEIPGGGAGAAGYGEGGGIFQDLTLGSGQLTINYNIAAYSLGNNAQAGNFLLFLDGELVSDQLWGGINYGQWELGTMSYSGMVNAGSHEIALDFRRGYGLGVGNTPFQYAYDVVLGGSAVPEPSAILLLSVGLAAIAGVRCKRKFRDTA